MPLDPNVLLSLCLPDIEESYTERDVILYALGIGLGHDPLDERQLCYVYEKNLVALPSMANVLACARLQGLDVGVDQTKMVHSRQKIVLHRPLPLRGTVVSSTRIAEVVDHGIE